MTDPINYVPDPIPEQGKVYGGGLGFGRLPRKAVVSLSHGQILSLPSTPVRVLAETEVLDYSGQPARLPLLERVVLHWASFGGVAYGNISGGGFIFLAYGSDGGGTASGPLDANVFLVQGNSRPVAQLFPMAFQADGLFSGRVETFPVNIRNSIFDNGLYLSASNSGSYTAGHASDIVRVSLLYRIFNTQTGEFE